MHFAVAGKSSYEDERCSLRHHHMMISDAEGLMVAYWCIINVNCSRFDIRLWHICLWLANSTGFMINWMWPLILLVQPVSNCCEINCCCYQALQMINICINGIGHKIKVLCLVPLVVFTKLGKCFRYQYSCVGMYWCQFDNLNINLLGYIFLCY